MKGTVPLEEAERRHPQRPYGDPAARAIGRSFAPLRTIDPLRWEGQPVPPRRWLIEGLIPHGSVTMLSGDGGLGKSLLTLQLVVAAATGRSWLKLPTTPCKAFGVYCEDDHEELHRRLADILSAEQLAFADLENLMLVSRVGEANEFISRDKYGKPRGPSPFFEQVLHAAKSFGAQLVILDGLHDLFDGNENSRPEARQFVNLLRRIALDIDGAVLLCAHPSRAGLTDGTGTSGSTAWNNAVRSRVYLSRPRGDSDDEPNDPDARVLTTKKANYGKIGDEIRVRWYEGVFVRDEPEVGQFASIQRRAYERRACDAFLACLDTICRQGRNVTDARNSPRYAPKVFSAMPEAEGAKLRELERAMSLLFNDRSIRIGAVTGPDRKPMKAIIRAPGGAE